MRTAGSAAGRRHGRTRALYRIRARASWAMLAISLLAAPACRVPATEVVVHLDSNARPDQTLTVRVVVSRGAEPDASGDPHTFVFHGPLATGTLPGTFAVTPGPSPNDGTVTLVVQAHVDASGTSPAVDFRRLARFAFAPRTTTFLQIYLDIDCGVPATGCTSASAPCTAAELCEERGMTCGDHGMCVAVDTPTQRSVDAAADAADAVSDAPDVAVDVPPVPTAPRPVAPLSTSVVTSQRPTLKWALGTSTDGVQFDLCRNRAMTTGCLGMQTASGTQLRLTSALAPGDWYWRLTGTVSGVVRTGPSATWMFRVGHRDTPVDSSYGGGLDVNLDGYADIAIGAYGAVAGAGRAYLFLGSQSGPPAMPSTRWDAPDPTDLQFGSFLASAGDVNGDGFGDVIIGAQGSVGQTGRAYVYFGGASGAPAAPNQTLVGPDGMGGFFGEVSGAGDVNGDGYGDVIVSARAAAADAGRAYVYLGSAGGLAIPAATTLIAPDGGEFGTAVAGAGDVNGDGFGDVVAGAPAILGGSSKVYVYFGGASGIARMPSLTITGPGSSGYGHSAACAGDVNGDGYSDVVIGAPYSNAGSVFVYLGGAAGLATTPSATIAGQDGSGSNFGLSVAGAGDVDGNGYSEIIAGADNAATGVGRAYVYSGGAGGVSSTPSSSLSGLDGTNTYFGVAVAGTGDVNGDGFDDALVAAYASMSDTGRVYYYASTAGRIANMPSASFTGPDGMNGYFGVSLARARTSPRPEPWAAIALDALRHGAGRVDTL